MPLHVLYYLITVAYINMNAIQQCCLDILLVFKIQQQTL